MRVVQLGPFPPPHGGVQTNIVAIRDYVRQQGHFCAVINITRHRKEEIDDVFYPEGAIELVWDLIRGRYDIVHLHVGGDIPTRVSALAAVCASVPGTKSVFTLHSGGFPSSEEARSTGPNSFRAIALRRFDFLTGVNQQILQFFHRVGVPEAKTRLVSPHSFAKDELSERLSEPLASFFQRFDKILVAVCLLEPQYDIPLQIRALGRVLEAYPSTGLAIVGSGSVEQDLRRQIAASGYPGNVLLCGDVPHSETLRAIADASALLRTTIYDGDAISIREALYLGTPVIATDNGMRPDGVELTPIGDLESLERCILGVLSREKVRKQVIAGDNSNVAQVLQIYEELLRP